MIIQNIISNYIAKVWGFVSLYLFIPLYINYIGIEAYGVINFYTVLFSLLLFADAGLSATLSREFARSEDLCYKRNLLFTVEKVYAGIAFLITTLLIFSAPWIVRTWIRSDTLPVDDLVLSVRLMGVAIALQFYATLHNGGLVGLQKQVLSNSINIIWSIVRSGLVVILLMIWPSILTFFYWQIICNLVYFLANRLLLWRQIASSEKPIFDKRSLMNLKNFAGGMMIMALIASLNTQIDKLLVSKYLSLEYFSYYSLAATLSQLPVIAITPLTIAFYPNLVKLVGMGSHEEIKLKFHDYSYLISVVSSIFVFSVFFYTKDLAMLWVNNEDIVMHITFITKVLSIGGLFLCVQYMPFNLAIAHGHTRTNQVLGLVIIVIYIPLFLYFIDKFGFEGTGYPWLILNLCAVIYLGYRLINRFLEKEFYAWVWKDVLIPISMNFGVFYLVFLFFYSSSVVTLNLLYIILSIFLCIVVNFFLYSFLYKKKTGILDFMTAFIK